MSWRRLTGLVGALSLMCIASGAPTAYADECAAEGDAEQSVISIGMTCSEPGVVSNTPVEEVADGGERIFVEYVWLSACTAPNRAAGGAVLDCEAARACPKPNERIWRLWGRMETPDAWVLLGAECLGSPPTGEDAPGITITPGMVLNEIRRIGLPTLQAYTQPEGKTLVNFATIFYTQPQPFTRTVTILGQRVELEATPVQYTWHHGDGTSKTTVSPGAPYPSKEITHHYRDAHTTVTPRVDATYGARFRVNGGGWQDIDDTVTIQGPTSDLRVSEATAVLSGSYK